MNAERHVPSSDHTSGHDERILLRPVRPEDDAGLAALYDALDIDARVLRFFSAYHPAPGFFTELATVDGAHGARVVAVEGSATEETIIGEAGYRLLPNGNGELGITVADGRRDRLAPVLLDALLAHASAAGVPNLEADVLTANRPLMDLLRVRGATVIQQQGWRTARLLIRTMAPATRPPAPSTVTGPCGLAVP